MEIENDNRTYYEKNKEKVKAYYKQYYELNRLIILAKRRKKKYKLNEEVKNPKVVKQIIVSFSFN